MIKKRDKKIFREDGHRLIFVAEFISNENIIWAEDVDNAIRIKARALISEQEICRASQDSPPQIRGDDQVTMVNDQMHAEFTSDS